MDVKILLSNQQIQAESNRIAGEKHYRQSLYDLSSGENERPNSANPLQVSWDISQDK